MIFSAVKRGYWVLSRSFCSHHS